MKLIRSKTRKHVTNHNLSFEFLEHRKLMDGSGLVQFNESQADVADGECCEIELETTDKSENAVQIDIAEGYGDDETKETVRADVRRFIDHGVNTVRPAEERDKDEVPTVDYSASNPPATAYAFYQNGMSVGNVSAFARSVLTQPGSGSDVILETETVHANAEGTLEKTLTIRPKNGKLLYSLVVGASIARTMAQSRAFDPISGHEVAGEIIRTVGKKSLEAGLRGLRAPEIVKEGVEWGYDQLTDVSARTWAYAQGSSRIEVGRHSEDSAVQSQVLYTRQGFEKDAVTYADVIWDGEQLVPDQDGVSGRVVQTITASDSHPTSLTTTVNSDAWLAAGAEGHGNARANLSGLYGTVLIAIYVCETDDGDIYASAIPDVQANAFTHLPRDKAQSDAITRANIFAPRDLVNRVETIVQGIDQQLTERGENELDADTITENLEGVLQNWADAYDQLIKRPDSTGSNSSDSLTPFEDDVLILDETLKGLTIDDEHTDEHQHSVSDDLLSSPSSAFEISVDTKEASLEAQDVDSVFDQRTDSLKATGVSDESNLMLGLVV